MSHLGSPLENMHVKKKKRKKENMRVCMLSHSVMSDTLKSQGL